jgi:hypothetical protein
MPGVAAAIGGLAGADVVVVFGEDDPDEAQAMVPMTRAGIATMARKARRLRIENSLL